MSRDWICCQVGAREHYSIPRAIHRMGRLERLITDCWAAPQGWGALPGTGGLRDRFHPDLEHAPISSWTMRYLGFEARSRLMGRHGWQQVIRRNDWLQKRAQSGLERLRSDGQSNRTLFSYSYAALRLFEYAKTQGWKTILGQIDPGPAEERIVSGLRSANPALAGAWLPAPESYWENWKAECALADIVVVNSSWSQRCLVEEGIPAAKVRVVPLAYEEDDSGVEKDYPAAFSTSRPLKVLFLGQVNLRKGVSLLLEVIGRLRDAPVQFWIVGEVQVPIPAEMKAVDSVRWIGPCLRSEVHRYYREADVFVFPTHSDGFGLTQLEAARWRLPIIASRNCGEVVDDGVNGTVLTELSAERLEAVLRFCLANPGQLAQWSKRARPAKNLGIQELADALLTL